MVPRGGQKCAKPHHAVVGAHNVSPIEVEANNVRIAPGRPGPDQATNLGSSKDPYGRTCKKRLNVLDGLAVVRPVVVEGHVTQVRGGQ